MEVRKKIWLGIFVLMIISGVIYRLLSPDPPPPPQLLHLSYNGQPFTAIYFDETYREGMRYIKIKGSVEGQVGDYLFDLAEESVMSFAGNEYLHHSFAGQRFTVSVLCDNTWQQLDDKLLEKQILAKRRGEQTSLFIMFVDKLGKIPSFQIDLYKIEGFATTDTLSITFSDTGKYTELYSSNSTCLIDMITHKIIWPPVGFDEGKGIRLIGEDARAIYANEKVWDIETNRVIALEYDRTKYKKRITGDGEYIYWGGDFLYGCSTITGKTKLLFDGTQSTNPNFDDNDIKIISEEEVAAVGTKLREWDELGMLPGPNNYWIMKYNMSTGEMTEIKMSALYKSVDRSFAWSSDESAAYFFYAYRMGIYKQII